MGVASEEVAGPPRRRRTRIGWRQVAAQLLFVVAVAAFLLALLSYGGVVAPKTPAP
ncbi:hypothetical protein AB0N07_47560 [Streptomyces sp. NPDC051172]|uniref:hypothetical protein n=1 Tax=Streptomyces sp. NPDC051172 TaxID=3155796 RepID=UPI0034332D8A